MNLFDKCGDYILDADFNCINTEQLKEVCEVLCSRVSFCDLHHLLALITFTVSERVDE